MIEVSVLIGGTRPCGPGLELELLDAGGVVAARAVTDDAGVASFHLDPGMDPSSLGAARIRAAAPVTPAENVG